MLSRSLRHREPTQDSLGRRRYRMRRYRDACQHFRTTSMDTFYWVTKQHGIHDFSIHCYAEQS